MEGTCRQGNWTEACLCDGEGEIIYRSRSSGTRISQHDENNLTEKKGEWKQVKDESEAEDRFFLCEAKKKRSEYKGEELKKTRASAVLFK